MAKQTQNDQAQATESWQTVVKGASGFIFDMVVLMICVALLFAAYLEFSRS